MIEKIFIYLRVSTELQTEESQLFSINQFLKSHPNIEVIPRSNTQREFIDHAKSAFKKIKGSKIPIPRIAFNEMLSRLHEVDGILGFEWDRLQRDEALGIKLMYDLKEGNKKFYDSCNGKIYDYSKWGDRLETAIKSMMAENERNTIHERMMAGIKAYKEKNKRWGRKKYKMNWKRYEEFIAKGMSRRGICLLLGISYKTLQRCIREKKYIL